MIKYLTLWGCDSHTVIPIKDITPEQVIFLTDLCNQSTQISTFQCMPTMELGDTNIDEWEGMRENQDSDSDGDL